MPVDPPRSGLPRVSREARARIVLEEARRQVAKAPPGSSLPTSDVLIRRLATALQISQVDVLSTMRARKISYTHRGLTPGRVENFLRDALRYPVVHAQIVEPPESSSQAVHPAPDERVRAQELRNDRIRTAFKAHRARLDDPTVDDPRLQDLAAALVKVTGTQRKSIQRTMGAAGLGAPQRRTITSHTCERFISKLYGSVPATPERWPTTTPRPGAQDPPASRRAAIRQARETHTARAPQFPACQRLVDGIVAGSAAAATADVYLALLELTAYRSTAQAQAVAEIAADRFGIHADATTGARLGTRAKDAWHAGEGGVQLDHLSRLERRLRGVFYDGHLDRITAWDSSAGTLLLYTCSGVELRTAAAGALERGDLVPPVMRRQVVSATYEPTGADDPALVLAVAAEQLGRQASRALHPSAPRISRVEKDRMSDGRSPTPSPSARTVAAATWVQPVSGDWGGLVLEQMQSSYARHRAGPRTRAATTVRGYLRRAPGTSKSDPPTIPVRSHPRRGTGPGTPAPKVTKVSGRRQMWS